MSLGEAVNVFTKLTIGDGLVSQVPAFLISLAAGLIVTRSSSSTDLSRDVVGQLFSQPGVLGTAAVFLGLMALTPLPKLPLLTLGGSLGAGAFVLSSRRDGEGDADAPAGDREAGAVRADSQARSAESVRGRPGGSSPIDGLAASGRGRRRRAGRLRLGPDGRPAARRPARAGDRLPADRPGRPDRGAATCSTGSRRCASGWRARWA